MSAGLLGARDAVTEGTEACDDGVNDGGEAECLACAVIQTCGAGLIQGTEGCDDGNNAGGDGCAADCTVEP